MEEDAPVVMETKQAADYIHVHENTIRRWADAGFVRCYRLPGNRKDRRFYKEDLDKVLLAY